MKILIVDGHSIAYRAYHALIKTNLTAPDRKTPTAMITGFIKMLFSVQNKIMPEKIFAVFDAGGKNFRHALLPEYKANRKPLDDNFKIQLPILQDLLKFLGYPVISVQGVEADDLIASLVSQAEKNSHEVFILSSDKDLFQLLARGVVMMRPIKHGVSEAEIYDTEKFLAEYNFLPEFMADYLALTGDSSDNIKGVDGIGEKTAQQIISEMNTIENTFEKVDALPERVKRKIEKTTLEDVLQVRELTKLKYDFIDDKTFNECLTFKADLVKAKTLALKLGLNTLIKQIDPENKITPEIENKSADKNIRVHKVESSDEKIVLPELVLVDYKKELENNNERVKNYDPQKIFDLHTAYYLLHPDTAYLEFDNFIEDLKDDENFDEAITDEAKWLTEVINKYSGLTDVMRKIDVPLIPVLVEMQNHGIKIDRQKFTELQNNLTSRIDEIEFLITKEAGKRINLQSPQQVSWLLFEKLNFKGDKMTKSKKFYSTDESVLKRLASLKMNAIPDLMLEHRELTTMLNYFVMPFQDLADKNNILRTVFEPAKTGTGRLSSRDPNLQNIPTSGKWANDLKAALVPVNEGNTFISADYSQIELRVLAFLSGEEKLLDAFKSGRDIHTETAAQVFDISPDFVDKDMRRTAKMINYGLLYGMKEFGLAERLNISREQAKEIMQKYFCAFPKIEAYTKNSIAKSKSHGYTQTYYGRIRPIDEIPATGSAINRALINSPVQGTAADIARKAMLEYSRVGEGLFLQVHDSLICECPESKADECKNLLAEVMKNITNGEITLEVNLKAGKSLAYV